MGLECGGRCRRAGLEVVDEDRAGSRPDDEGKAVVEKGDARERDRGVDDLDDLLLKHIVEHNALIMSHCGAEQVVDR